jgi:hypothetical protein
MRPTCLDPTPGLNYGGFQLLLRVSKMDPLILFFIVAVGEGAGGNARLLCC